MERRRREGDDEEEKERRKDWGGGLLLEKKVRGQIIKSVRLLAISSNLKELINAASQACGSANQLSNQCLAMLMPSQNNMKDRMSERKT